MQIFDSAYEFDAPGAALVQREAPRVPGRGTVAEHRRAGCHEDPRGAGRDRRLEHGVGHRGVDREDRVLGGAERDRDRGEVHHRVGREAGEQDLGGVAVGEVGGLSLVARREGTVDAQHGMAGVAQRLRHRTPETAGCAGDDDSHGCPSGSDRPSVSETGFSGH